MKSLRGKRSKPSRYVEFNRERGERARAHLERARERERRRLRDDGRARERNRTRGPHDGARQRRVGRSLVFLASLAAGVLLASPLQYVLQTQLTRLSTSGMGRVESIAIQGNAHLSFADVAEATGVAPDSPLSEVDIPAVIARLESQDWIRDAQVLVLPPSTLLVRVEERQPSAVLLDGTNRVLGQDDEFAEAGRLIDATGMPFAALRGRRPVLGASDLPRIVGGQELPTGERHAALVTALALLERFDAPHEPALSALSGRVRVHLPGGDAEGWVLEVPDRSLRIVLGEERLLERFDRLAALLRARLPALSQPVRIDLRFADQAVLQELTASG